MLHGRVNLFHELQLNSDEEKPGKKHFKSLKVLLTINVPGKFLGKFLKSNTKHHTGQMKEVSIIQISVRLMLVWGVFWRGVGVNNYKRIFSSSLIVINSGASRNILSILPQSFPHLGWIAANRLTSSGCFKIT